MSRRRQQLTLECQQPSPNHVGLGGVELICEALEALTLVSNQIDLEWCRFPHPATCHDSTS